MSQQIYWMVHCANGSGSPNVKHPTLNAAVKEAKHRAFNCPNSHFTVLQVVDCYMMPSDGAYQVPLTHADDEMPVFKPAAMTEALREHARLGRLDQYEARLRLLHARSIRSKE